MSARLEPSAMSNNNGTNPLDDLAKEGRRIQELVEKIETLQDPAARIMLQDCLQSVLGFYGHGLARILEVVGKTDGKKVYDALIHDPGISGLLLIHGLHPIPLETRLNDALEKVRPYMQSHGGNVELLNLKSDFAVLKLEGHCKICPSSTVTLELAVRHAIEEACPIWPVLKSRGFRSTARRPMDNFSTNPTPHRFGHESKRRIN